MEDERNWFVGVDWASETHHVQVSDARGRKLGARVRSQRRRSGRDGGLDPRGDGSCP